MLQQETMAALRCPGDIQGTLRESYPAIASISPAIYTVHCPNHQSRPIHTHSTTTSQPLNLLARQQHPPPICQDACTTSCYSSANQYNSSDCSSLSNWMWQREAQFTVNPNERVVLAWGTCMYTFINQRPRPVTWCDAQWAQIGMYLASPCQNQGGECAGDGFKAEVILNDGTDHTPLPYSAMATPLSISESSSTSLYTQVPLPSLPTASSSSTLEPTSNSTYATGPSVPLTPMLIGIIGGVLLVLIAILAFIAVWRKTRKPIRYRLPSDVGHGSGNSANNSSYSLRKQQKGTRIPAEGVNTQSQTRTAPQGDGGLQVPEAATGSSLPDTSRVPTSLSTYTIDFDPFRPLRRALSRNQ